MVTLSALRKGQLSPLSLFIPIHPPEPEDVRRERRMGKPESCFSLRSVTVNVALASQLE